MSDWPELDRIDPKYQIDPYILLERRWRKSLVRRPNKHDPVFSTGHILQEAHDGSATALRLIAFNRAYPSKRHWHHRVHLEFGEPCDDECKPKHTYTGSSVVRSFIERIKDAYTIEDIAGQHMQLRGTHTLGGPCFLHGGSGDEFKIWVDEQKWRCFGQCLIGGDVIDLIRAMKERGIEWQTTSR